MLIFVHMLKAGGTSLRGLLEPLFGARLVRDYDDIPMSNRPEHGWMRTSCSATSSWTNTRGCGPNQR